MIEIKVYQQLYNRCLVDDVPNLGFVFPTLRVVEETTCVRTTKNRLERIRWHLFITHVK